MTIEQLLPMMGQGILETLYMTVVSTICAYLIGLPLGVALVYWAPGGLSPKPKLHSILNTIVNIMRSVPFLILMMVVMPLSRFIVGTTIGSTAVIVPLVISAAPYVGRMVESSLLEVDVGVLEMAQSIGASHWQIIRRVYLGEALPSLINGGTISMTTIFGYSAMAAMIGGGGLGAIAVTYGYYRYQYDILLISTVLMVIFIQIIQWMGTFISKRVDKRR